MQDIREPQLMGDEREDITLNNINEIFPHLYENIPIPEQLESPILIITGPSGSGKDTLLDKMVSEKQLEKIVTCTTRKRRYKFNEAFSSQSSIQQILQEIDNVNEYNILLNEYEHQGILTAENFEAYHWLQWPEKTLTEEQKGEYFEKLIFTKQLIEHNFHFNNLYGLSAKDINFKTNILQAIRTDLFGMKTLVNIFKEQSINTVTLGIFPDNWQQIREAMIKREDQVNKEILEDRMHRSKMLFELYPDIINFFLKNSRQFYNGRQGLDLSFDAMRNLIMIIQSHRKVEYPK